MIRRIIIMAVFLFFSSSLYAVSAAEQTDKFADTQKNILRLKEYLREAQNKKGELEKKVEQLNRMIETKDTEMDTINKDYSNFKEEVNEKVSSQKELNEDLYKELNALKLQVGQKEASVVAPDPGKSGILDTKIAELNDLVTSLRNANVYLERQISQKDAEKVDLEIKLRDAKSEADKASQRNDELQKKIVPKADNLAALLDKASQERNDLLSLQANTVDRLGEMTAVNIYMQEKLLDIFKELGALTMQETPDKAKIEVLFKKVEAVLETATSGSEE